MLLHRLFLQLVWASMWVNSAEKSALIARLASMWVNSAEKSALIARLASTWVNSAEKSALIARLASMWVNSAEKRFNPSILDTFHTHIAQISS
ncbi:hypothetical protein PaecuDRAFT_3917 [Paenibacillus curdlanolyticus YK9]|uniref:Uncharacterized protein n=1 Tax=Paenibacillus curdlanolyticus YK9 TaxID=717606 RepID=E0IE26_9BACL|nr:hypothetical protein PaecuDRAFT_3917 [Paenibacillus curdlanolyticus YK9]